MLTEQEIRGDLTSLEPLEYFNPITNEWLIEQWKPIKNYEDCYEVSDCGRVKSFYRNGRIRKTSTNHRGYSLVLLSKQKTFRSFTIHTLVWDHFGDGSRDGIKIQVDHKDNDKLNNRIDNLQLLTSRENTSKGCLISKRSGLPTGVCWNKNTQSYMTRINVNKKNIYLGFYTTSEEASEAYRNKLKEISI